MKSILQRVLQARLAVAEDPRASISVKDESSKDALDGAHMLHRHESEDETEAMRKSRREQEERAKHEKVVKRKAEVEKNMEEQGLPRLIDIAKLHAKQREQLAKLHAKQREQLNKFAPVSLDEKGNELGLFNYPKPQ